MFLVLTNLLQAAGPKVLGMAIDHISKGPDMKTLRLFAGVILLISVVQGIFRFLMRYVLIGISRKIEFELRNDYFAYLETQAQDFYTANRTGDLMTRATDDLNSVRMVLGPGIMWTSNTVVFFTFAIIAMIIIDPHLTLFALIPFPLLSYIIFLFGKKFHVYHEYIQKQFSKISTKAQENLAGIRVIKAYTREESEIEEFRKLSEEYVERNRKMIRVWSLFFPIVRVMGGVGMIVVLWYGGSRVIDGKLSLGDFVAFNGYLMMLLWPMIALGWVTNLVQRGAASMGRISAVLEQGNSVTESDSTVDLLNPAGAITVKNLTFTFSGAEKPALKDFSLTVPAGSVCAVTGPTGSGKSTLLKILSRAYRIDDGIVSVDGRDINGITLRSLRGAIGYVPQETFLFSESILENIRYGCQDCPQEVIEKFTKFAGMHDEIESFPGKYETLLGERGVNLSGGQKQRVALARALVKQPAILMLDDALSAVDTETEEYILSHLKTIMKERTSIIISQRISTIKHADLILYMEEGMIRESGTHEALIGRGGRYAALYEKQLLTRELESANSDK